MNDVTGMATNNPGLNMGTSGSMREQQYSSDDLWDAHNSHWQSNFHARPYAQADRGYAHYQPAYRYGHDAAHRHHGREWDEVESDLERDWHATHGSSSGSTWQDMKHAARDAWDRVRGR